MQRGPETMEGSRRATPHSRRPVPSRCVYNGKLAWSPTVKRLSRRERLLSFAAVGRFGDGNKHALFSSTSVSPFFFLSQKKKKGHALNLWYESSRLQRSRPVGVIQQHRRRNKKNRYLQWCWTRYIASLLKAWWAHFFFKEEGKIKFKKRKGL